MMSSERAPEELDEVNPRTRPRRPNTTLDSDGVRNERIRSLKNTRRGHIANVTAKVNEVIELLSDEGNVQEVKEKLTTSKEAFRKFGEAHRSYAAELVNKEEKTKCMEYFSREEKSTEIIDRHGDVSVLTSSAFMHTSSCSYFLYATCEKSPSLFVFFFFSLYTFLRWKTQDPSVMLCLHQ